MNTNVPWFFNIDGTIPAPKPDDTKIVTEEEIIKACIQEWSNGSWSYFLKRLREKHGLVVRKLVSQ